MSRIPEEDWHSAEETLRRINEFHENYARYPRDQIEDAKDKYLEYMERLEAGLRDRNLCKKPQFAGSTYENLKIGFGGLEYDVMFIRDGTGLRICPVPSVSGYSFLKDVSVGDEFSRFTDAQGNLCSKKVVSAFYGTLQKIFHEQEVEDLITLKQHGPAVQMKVHKEEGDSEPWFTVDLVPAYEVFDVAGKSVKFVPKGIENPARPYLSSAWRRSFSEEEKALLKGIDKDHGCRKKSLRILKAICCGDASFNILQSYHLKTLLFHALEKRELQWGEKDLADRVFGLLRDLHSALEKKTLKNFFVRKRNLFASLHEASAKNLANRIRRLLKIEEEFMELLDAT